MQKVITYLKKLSLAQQVLLLGWMALMLLLPFHGLISTWGGTTIGPYAVWKVWKELLLLILFVPTVVLLKADRRVLHLIASSWVFRIAAVYSALHIVIALFISRDPDATFYGLAINLRIIGMFFVSYVLFSSLRLSRKTLTKILLVPCALVVFFGVLQLFVLPTNFLAWFGYERGVTITPDHNIDDQPDKIRIMSTLRGPNPLGAYLILPGTLIISLILLVLGKIKNQGLHRKSLFNLAGLAILLGSLLVVIYGAQGRAAWIGFMMSVALALFFLISKKMRLYGVLIAVTLLLLGGIATYQLKNTQFVQTVILHDNPNTGAQASTNDVRITAAKDSLGDVAQKPLTGCGPGCAGPASFYYNGGINLAENYYIQIAQEIGILGTILFVAFVVLVGKELLARRSDYLALALFASLIGISIANLLLHVWADDTLAYVWWGLAGAVLASYNHQDSSTASAKRLRTSG